MFISVSVNTASVLIYFFVDSPHANLIVENSGYPNPLHEQGVAQGHILAEFKRFEFRVFLLNQLP